MTPRVVYDTNVVVSAALKAGSIPASLVTLALDRRVRLCLSPVIFAEYEAVLKRPKFAFDPHTVEAFLRDLRPPLAQAVRQISRNSRLSPTK